MRHDVPYHSLCEWLHLLEVAAILKLKNSFTSRSPRGVVLFMAPLIVANENARRGVFVERVTITKRSGNLSKSYFHGLIRPYESSRVIARWSVLRLTPRISAIPETVSRLDSMAVLACAI